MIDKKLALKILKEKLRGQVNVQSLREDPERVKILRDTLARAAGSETHANAMLDAWVDNSQFVPAPADLTSIARRIADPSRLVLADPCERCRKVEWVDSFDADCEVIGVRRCDCARGRSLLAADKARAAAEREQERGNRRTAGMERAGACL